MEDNTKKSGLQTMGQCCFVHWRGVLSLCLPIAFGIAMAIDHEAPYRTFYMFVAMLICWLTELYPIAVTAMIPIIGFPLMNIMVSDKTCSLYFKDTLVMLLVSVMVAATIESTKLHTRVAIIICKVIGPHPKRLHILLVVLTTILTSDVPNSVCIAFMCPLTNAILEQMAIQGVFKIYESDDPAIPKPLRKPSQVAICFYLSVAYACSMGGTLFFIGSTTNLLARDIYEERFPSTRDKIDFANFSFFTIFPMLVCISLMCLCMEITHMGLFRPNSTNAMAVQLSEDKKVAATVIANEKYEALGRITLAEITTLIFFFIIFTVIPFRHPEEFKGWGDVLYGKETRNSTVVALVLFLIFSLPTTYYFFKCWDEKASGKTPGLLSWKFVNTYVPWDLIFIIGCGGPLAEGSRLSGLARKLGDFLTTFKSMNAAGALFFSMMITLLCTNFTVNAAVITVIAPGILQMAKASKIHPLYFLMPNTLMCSTGFLMPAATGPNALVAAFGNIRTHQMIFAGFGPTLLTWLIVFLFSISWGTVVYPDLSDYPKWMDDDAGANYGEEIPT